MKNRTLILLFSSFLLMSLSLLGQHNHNLDPSQSKFIENKGQWDRDVLFYSHLPSAEIIIKQGEVNYVLKDNKVYDSLLFVRHEGTLDVNKEHRYSSALIKMKILGAEETHYNGFKSYNEKRNYFLGQDKTKWATDVSAYEAVQAGEVLEGIDFKIYHFSNSIKHEFHVDSKIDYKKIRLEYSGFKSIQINNKGELEIETPLGSFKEDHPVAYQIIKGKHVFVPCEFVLNDDQTVSYKLGKKYKKKFPIVIDPQLIFSTASGSTADNWGNTACLDNSGNLYTGGTVFANPVDGFPSTVGSFDQVFNGGGTDIGILKFDSSGQNLIYATYIGGDDSEIPTSMVANEDQELFILGVTGSTDFPAAVNAFAGGSRFVPVGGYTFENGSAITVIKLDATGANIIKSHYVGGPGNDGNNMKFNLLSLIINQLSVINYGDELRGEIIIDAEDNIYVASSTNNNQSLGNDPNVSPNFPTVNAFQPNFGGGFQDGVVFKLHHSLNNLVWASYLGGTRPDAAYGLKFDGDSSLYVTGTTESDLFTRDTTALNPDNHGFYDGFITRIDTNGSAILNYSYLGTPQREASYFVEIDDNKNVYLLGQTFGDYGHSSPDIYFVDREGIFIHKLGPKLDTSFFYTTIGDTTVNPIAPNISPKAFLVNECENIFISGWGGATNRTGTFTLDLPITPNAYQTTSDGSDFYMAVFLKDMDTLLFATYFGIDGINEHVDGGTSRFDDQGIVYQSVCAGCTGGEFILFSDPKPGEEGDYPQQNASTNCNNGVFKYDLASLNAIIKTESLCAPLTTSFTNETLGGIDYTWHFGDGADTTVTTRDPIEHTYTTAGTYTVKMITTDITTCKRKDTSSIVITVSDKLIEKVYADTLCKDDVKEFTEYIGLDFNSFKWTPSSDLSSDTLRNPEITGNETITYAILLTDSLGCTRADTLNLFVPAFKPDLVLDIIPNCKHNSTPKVELTLNYTSNFTPNSVKWEINEATVTTNETSFVFEPTNLGVQKVTSTTNSKNCFFSDTASINIIKTEIPNVITPNGDGLNDEFVLTGIEGSGKWNLDIFNRWGKAIYKSDDYQNDWNAEGNTESTYFYEIESPDGNKCKGWVQVLR